MRAAKQMLAIQPKYVSVTFGAGGSTRAGTADAVRTLRNLGCDAAPHLSCVGASRQDLRDILQAYKNEGVRRVVALRGDLPSGMGGDAGELRYANELVSFIREETGDWFHIEVAAYPEMHPQAASPSADLAHFVAKAGRRQRRHHAIFLQRRRLFRLRRPGPGQGRERADRAGHHAHHQPLAAAALSEMCGAEVPRWIRLRLAEFGDDKASIRAFGVDVVTELCQTLLDNGAPGVHFYTLNHAEAPMAIWRELSR